MVRVNIRIFPDIYLYIRVYNMYVFIYLHVYVFISLHICVLYIYLFMYVHIFNTQITEYTDVTCSGHGTCEYSDPSGSILESCTVLESTCTAACICASGFGGADCSLNAVDTAVKDSVR
jgi:hypothetical protein